MKRITHIAYIPEFGGWQEIGSPQDDLDFADGFARAAWAEKLAGGNVKNAIEMARFAASCV